jgi:hypothetical protein
MADEPSKPARPSAASRSWCGPRAIPVSFRREAELEAQRAALLNASPAPRETSDPADLSIREAARQMMGNDLEMARTAAEDAVLALADDESKVEAAARCWQRGAGLSLNFILMVLSSDEARLAALRRLARFYPNPNAGSSVLAQFVSEQRRCEALAVMAEALHLSAENLLNFLPPAQAQALREVRRETEFRAHTTKAPSEQREEALSDIGAPAPLSDPAPAAPPDPAPAAPLLPLLSDPAPVAPLLPNIAAPGPLPEGPAPLPVSPRTLLPRLRDLAISERPAKSPRARSSSPSSVSSSPLLSPGLRAPPPSCENSPRGQADAAGETQKTAASEECRVCMERPIDHVAIPCGHMAVCGQCAQHLLTAAPLCVICRGPVERFVKVFKS